ncbi:hypothetical protein EIN_134990 [Entamoeba invadens IP1]|uniref:Uncharacterized protein n=1 Tax=Entamoeba invadens IP1 TaxID=370355 RepID=A0A0A1TX79_ENTIV|nr:hypothetical protein EIN_134990 [Entamoeba invadens IP1]ELP85915.1 hypothetical protein EIN_134990 [Entamoeba invadens IP1]|eukprot:XP_004185261.1 hypothetical protein EIN_134990 [Entamoeba invadens IP1]
MTKVEASEDISDVVSSIPQLSLTPFGDTEEVGFIDFSNGLFVVEFDNVSGETISYKHLNIQLTPTMEKEIIRMIMVADYYEYSPVTVLIHTINIYYIASIHFTCFNPSNKRGYVTTCCVAVIQSVPFTTPQTELLIERLTQIASAFQKTALLLKDVRGTYDSVMPLETLINTARDPKYTFKQIINTFTFPLLTTHLIYSPKNDFANYSHPSHIIACGGHSLFNWSMESPYSEKSKKGDTKKRKVSQREYQQDFPTPFPPYVFPSSQNEKSNKYGFPQFVTDLQNVFPSVLLSLLSGLQIIIYSSVDYEKTKLVDIAMFLSSFCFAGVSNGSNPNILVIDRQDVLDPLQTKFTQIFVLCETTSYLASPFVKYCHLDVSTGFYGLRYTPSEMKNSRLDSFIRYAVQKKPFIEQKMWNVLIDYGELATKCLMYPDVYSKLPDGEKFIVLNLQRKIEQERIYVETDEIVAKRAVIPDTRFGTTSLKSGDNSAGCVCV